MRWGSTSFIMFKQYRKAIQPFTARVLETDDVIDIVYPASRHATYVSGQDFYVMGTFAAPVRDEKAVLRVLVTDAAGKVLREVVTDRRNNFAGVNVKAAGLETSADEEAVRRSAMPDLVYDPAEPSSYGYTWNKAFYTENAFAVLVYGGMSCKNTMCPVDQYGEALEPLVNGIYQITVELQTAGAVHRTTMELRIADETKEIVISRYTDEQHMRNVERFAQENGFETYMEPCAGNWAPEGFPFPWPGQAVVELPERWHLMDTLEYRRDVVHCFDYLLSETCLGYEGEIGTILHENPRNVDDPARCRFYYYAQDPAQAGNSAAARGQQAQNMRLAGVSAACEPQTHESSAAELFAVFAPGQYLAVTAVDRAATPDVHILRIRSVCKPIPAQTEAISDCRYRICNRIAVLRYAIESVDRYGEARAPEMTHPVGRMVVAASGKREHLLLESEHYLTLPAVWASRPLQIRVTAEDVTGKRWDEVTIRVE